jgi:hypothetical protein
MSLHRVGDCHASQGQFAEALSWFERAIAAKQQGDLHGRMDPARLEASVAAVARCHAACARWPKRHRPTSHRGEIPEPLRRRTGLWALHAAHGPAAAMTVLDP